MKRFNFLFIAVISLLLISCGKLKQNTATVTLSNEVFAGGENLYFRFNISDTTRMYKIFFTSRFSERYVLNMLPLGILYISPQGKRYSDTLKLFLNEGNYNTEYIKSGIWRDYRWVYRDKVVFPENGVWLVSVKNLHLKQLVGLKELGISLKEKK